MKTFRHTLVLNVFTSAENSSEAQKQSDNLNIKILLDGKELDVTWIDTDTSEVSSNEEQFSPQK